MPNKIIVTPKDVCVRIDDAYTTNEKHFVVPLDDRFFGSFRFIHPKEAKETLATAVKHLLDDGVTQDTIFNGQYPKWIEDEYGTSLKVNNRVRFFKSIDSQEEVPDLELRGFTYALEIHLSKTKDNGIFMRVPRAIVIGKSQRYNDDLFSDGNKLSEEDLPF